MSTVLLVGKGAPDRGGIPTFLETLRGGPLAQEHDLRFLNVAHAGVPEGGRATVGNIRRTVRDAVAVWRAARGRDVVHIHSALAPAVTVLRAALLAVAGRARGSAVVIHAHGGNIAFWLTTPLRRALLRIAMLPAHRVGACWTAGEQAQQRVLPAGRVALIDNGVPVGGTPEPQEAHDPPRVLYVGLLTPRKGVLDLLAASRLLRERGVAHELWLLGGTPDEGPAAEAEVRAELDASVRLLGTRAPQEMPAEFAAADVFCLPSWWEAMPLSVLEGMASGLPVVATDVGDVRTAVEDGHNGLLVRPRAPEELTAALAALLKDPELRRRMGANGRRAAEEHWSDHETWGQIQDAYRQLERR
jgi:glycosyltransferase involved in cell wall biosynthesis